MKGIGVYGAEIKVGGFSGYLCELLILHHTTFNNVLETAAAWKNPWILDFAKYYTGREDEIPKLFEELLVVVDPVDKGRNVASAVRQERLMEFVAASRQFLQHPGHGFFYPPPTKVFTERQLVKNMQARGTALIFIKFVTAKTVQDILWGQLYRTQRSLRNLLSQNDFGVVNDSVYSDEENLNFLVFELEHRFLPQSKKHFGPPIEKRRESEDFLRKYLTSPSTTSGPRIENDRWIVHVKRKQNDAVELFRTNLKDGGRPVGVPELISKAMLKSTEILVNEGILKTYLSNSSFAKFLTEYIKGKPRWLQN
jgi:tRNA nucleotidyltransferase (CCA-adding enzyme)